MAATVLVDPSLGATSEPSVGAEQQPATSPVPAPMAQPQASPPPEPIPTTDELRAEFKKSSSSKLILIIVLVVAVVAVLSMIMGLAFCVCGRHPGDDDALRGEPAVMLMEIDTIPGDHGGGVPGEAVRRL